MDDVRRNYLLIGTIWGNGLGSNRLANTTLETFERGKNCFDCHRAHLPDGKLSHMFGRQSPCLYRREEVPHDRGPCQRAPCERSTSCGSIAIDTVRAAAPTSRQAPCRPPPDARIRPDAPLGRAPPLARTPGSHCVSHQWPGSAAAAAAAATAAAGGPAGSNFGNIRHCSTNRSCPACKSVERPERAYRQAPGSPHLFPENLQHPLVASRGISA